MVPRPRVLCGPAFSHGSEREAGASHPSDLSALTEQTSAASRTSLGSLKAFYVNLGQSFYLLEPQVPRFMGIIIVLPSQQAWS